MRAVVVDRDGQGRLRDVAEPKGELLRVRACGLCGSDVEKLGRVAPGLVLGHEVVAEDDDGRRLALVHHLPCGSCERCRDGHESTCEEFRAATIVPGGFAEHVVATAGGIELPGSIDDALATYAEPLACVLRGSERVGRGDVLVVGGGFVGRLFAAVLRQRGDRVHVLDREPARGDGDPGVRFRNVVLTAPGAAETAVEHAEPGALVLVFADGGALNAGRVYRDELTLAGARSATPRHLEEAVALLPELDLPEPVVLPLERFDEGLELYRSRRVLKVVFTP